MSEKPTGRNTSNVFFQADNLDLDALAREKAYLADLGSKSLPVKVGGYFKLSGPGWIQSALSLGGGSGSLSLFAGALAGYTLLWVNPASMFLGVIMLGAIAYMTLSTGIRPFHAINQHVHPVLGWAWALSVLVANFVWIFGQFNVSSAVAGDIITFGGTREPAWFSAVGHALFGTGLSASEAAGRGFGVLVCPFIAILCLWVAWHYGKGTRGVRWFENAMKLVVAGIIVCFFIVVLTTRTDWGGILKGIFGFSLPRPSETDKLDVVISAFAAAVGINMTFILPYTILARGWGREHRTLAGFDLSLGMFVPFVFAVSCLTIAAGNTLHQTVYPEVEAKIAPLQAELQTLQDDTSLPAAERDARIAELTGLIQTAKAPLRTAVSMARSLEPLLGPRLSHIMFGLGFLGMTTSSIVTMMLVSGFTLCEIAGGRPGGTSFKIGTLLPALGMFGPIIFGQLDMYLMVPISVFCFFFSPIAYVAFFILMNKKAFLGDDLPRGWKRWAWNIAMLFAIVVVTGGGAYKIYAILTT